MRQYIIIGLLMIGGMLSFIATAISICALFVVKYIRRIKGLETALRDVSKVFDNYIVKPRNGRIPQGPIGACYIPPVEFAEIGEKVAKVLGEAE